MTRLFKREYATSLTAVTFLVIAISGVMMYFHLLDNYVKEMHEIIGLVFVGGVALHLSANWAAMKNYFPKSVFRIMAAVMLIVAIGFIATAKSGKSPKGQIIDAVLKAPIEQSFPILGNDLSISTQKLAQAGIQVSQAKTIDEIAKANHKSPFEIVDVLTK